MSEIIKQVEATRKEYLCDECKKGNMKYMEDDVYTHGGKYYKHECTYCGNMIWLENIYPSQIMIK